MCKKLRTGGRRCEAACTFRARIFSKKQSLKVIAAWHRIC